ncbi:hypothetical protein Tco_0803615 [Tanacetum coccineum]|uniref:Uncharacterized protein n=1 Tax=Tanacetum coccineum TaxID=301880 RepID=A0ABQ5A309_9ASTR
MTVNKIAVFDMVVMRYFSRGLGFSNVIESESTPYSEPIVSTASPTLTPFGDSDFLLMEEADSFLALEDDPTYREVDSIISPRAKKKQAFSTYPLCSARLMNEAQTPILLLRKKILLAVVYDLRSLEAFDFLNACTVDILGDTLVPITTARKIFDSGIYWPPSTRMPLDFVTVVTFVKSRKKLRMTRCTKLHTSFRILDIWGIDFMGPFPSSRGNKYSRIVKALDSVIFNSSFTSSASFWGIQYP